MCGDDVKECEEFTIINLDKLNEKEKEDDELWYLN